MDALRALLNRHVERGTIPGAVALLGGADAEPVGVGLPADAIFRIQSMTKTITTIATLMMVEAGRIRLDDPVVEWLPELADRRVLRAPTAALDDTVAADRPMTVRHLLTNTSGYGMALEPSPLQTAMADNGTEAGPDPVAYGADEWLARLADLPLAFQPGEGWRYHHSFGLLGILLSRVAGRPLGDHLADEVFAPLGLRDTASFVPADQLDRLPAAYRHGEDGLVEVDPAGGGFYAGPAPFDVSHAELVSTAADLHRVARLLVDGGAPLLAAEHVHAMTSDQVPQRCKTPESFFPGFWKGTGWGFGVAVQIGDSHRGRFGWSGGLGTDYFVDPDGTVGILLTQVEMGPALFPLIGEFQSLHAE